MSETKKEFGYMPTLVSYGGCGRYTVISAAKLINIVIQFMLDYKDDEKHMMIVK